MKEFEERYLKEIEKPSFAEIVDERFDSITTMLTPNAVLYGSTVASMIAGFPIEGDLDISVSHLEFMDMAKNLANSTKWLQVEGSRITEDDFSRKAMPTPYGGTVQITHSAGSLGYDSGSTLGKKVGVGFKPKSRYSEVPNLPVSQVVAFKTVNNVKVQIVESKESLGDPLEDALAVVRSVDFVFCGIGMDKYGRLLEVIEGAYDDCCKKVIRVANYDPLIKPSKFKQRFDKYMKRGWTLGISIEKAMDGLRKAGKDYMLREAERMKKLEARQAKQRSRQRKAPSKLYEIHDNSIVFRSEFLRVVPVGVLTEQVEYMSGKMGYHMSTIDKSPGSAVFTCENAISKSTLNSMAYKICQHINAKYGINVTQKIADNKKQKLKKRGGPLSKMSKDSSFGRYDDGLRSLGSPADEIMSEITASDDNREAQAKLEDTFGRLAKIDVSVMEEASSPDEVEEDSSPDEVEEDSSPDEVDISSWRSAKLSQEETPTGPSLGEKTEEEEE